MVINVLNNLSTYLKKENYRISILSNGLHVLNYKNLVDVTSTEALIKFDKHLIKVYGKNLILVELDKSELLLKGIIKKVEVTEY